MLCFCTFTDNLKMQRTAINISNVVQSQQIFFQTGVRQDCLFWLHFFLWSLWVILTIPQHRVTVCGRVITNLFGNSFDKPWLFSKQKKPFFHNCGITFCGLLNYYQIPKYKQHWKITGYLWLHNLHKFVIKFLNVGDLSAHSKFKIYYSRNKCSPQYNKDTPFSSTNNLYALHLFLFNGMKNIL
jgi:hypothetical protein